MQMYSLCKVTVSLGDVLSQLVMLRRGGTLNESGGDLELPSNREYGALHCEN